MFDDMKERKFKIGNVDFEIQKIGIMEKYRLTEEIRATLGEAIGLQSFEIDPDKLLNGTEIERGVEIGKPIASIFMQLPPEKVESLRAKLFEHVRFQNGKSNPKMTPLTNLEGTAFADLDVDAIYEVLARCFMVNFTKLFASIRSRILEIQTKT